MLLSYRILLGKVYLIFQNSNYYLVSVVEFYGIGLILVSCLKTLKLLNIWYIIVYRPCAYNYLPRVFRGIEFNFVVISLKTNYLRCLILQTILIQIPLNDMHKLHKTKKILSTMMI